MAFTENDLTAIEKALTSGTTRVKYQDKEVEYRSVSELIALRNQIKSELNASSSDDPFRRVMGVYDKGL